MTKEERMKAATEKLHQMHAEGMKVIESDFDPENPRAWWDAMARGQQAAWEYEQIIHDTDYPEGSPDTARLMLVELLIADAALEDNEDGIRASVGLLENVAKATRLYLMARGFKKKIEE